MAFTSPYDTVDLRALDALLRIRVTGSGAETLLFTVQQAWGACLVPTAAPVTETLTVCLDDDAEVVAHARSEGAIASRDLNELMSHLSSRITMMALDAGRSELLMMHACALRLAPRRAVVFVGASGAGKTTLARTLGREFEYITDEAVGVRLDLSIAPYAKPLSIMEGGPFKEQRSPASLELRPAQSETSVGKVFLLSREPGLVEARVDTVPLVRGLPLLAAQSSYLSHLARPLRRLAEAASAGGGLGRLSYSEAGQVARVLRSLNGHGGD